MADLQSLVDQLKALFATSQSEANDVKASVLDDVVLVEASITKIKAAVAESETVIASLKDKVTVAPKNSPVQGA